VFLWTFLRLAYELETKHEIEGLNTKRDDWD
jgi:hypothetical protein